MVYRSTTTIIMNTNIKTKTAKTEKSPMTVQTVHLEAEVNASFLVPKYVLNGRPLAIVDESVLERLKRLLKSADISDIVAVFQSKIPYVFSMEQWVKLLSEELAFHKTVNMLDTYFDPNIEKVIEKPFNVVEQPTLEQLYLKRNELEEQAKQLDEQIKNHPDREKEVQVAPH